LEQQRLFGSGERLCQLGSELHSVSSVVLEGTEWLVGRIGVALSMCVRVFSHQPNSLRYKVRTDRQSK
jgi:hypothetical protein